MDGTMYLLGTFALCGLGAAIAIFFGRRNKKNPNEMVDHFVIEYLNLSVLGIAGGLFISEAVVAMLLHPVGEKYTYDHGARYTQHMLISVTGVLVSIGAFHFMSDVLGNIRWLVFDEKIKYREKEIVIKPDFTVRLLWFLVLIAFVFMLGSTVIIPYWNSSIIAQGFDKYKEYQYILNRDLFLFSWQYTDNELIKMATQSGIDPFADSANALGYNGQINKYMMYSHYVCLFLKGILTLIITMASGTKGYVTNYRNKQKMLKLGLMKSTETLMFEQAEKALKAESDKSKVEDTKGKKEKSKEEKKEEKKEKEEEEKKEESESKEPEDEENEGDKIDSIKSVLTFFKKKGKLRKTIEETEEFFVSSQEGEHSQDTARQTMTAIFQIFNNYHDVITEDAVNEEGVFTSFINEMTSPLTFNGAGIDLKELEKYFVISR